MFKEMVDNFLAIVGMPIFQIELATLFIASVLVAWRLRSVPRIRLLAPRR